MSSKQCTNPIWTLDVSGILGPKYLPAVEDATRTIIIQITVQLLMSAIDGDPFFSGSFWLVLMYIILGTAGYHLLFRNAVRIV